MDIVDLSNWPTVIVDPVIELPADRHRRGYSAEWQNIVSWPCHRVIDGAVCRQTERGGRWERLDKAQADRLLDQITGAMR